MSIRYTISEILADKKTFQENFFEDQEQADVPIAVTEASSYEETKQVVSETANVATAATAIASNVPIVGKTAAAGSGLFLTGATLIFFNMFAVFSVPYIIIQTKKTIQDFLQNRKKIIGIAKITYASIFSYLGFYAGLSLGSRFNFSILLLKAPTVTSLFGGLAAMVFYAIGIVFAKMFSKAFIYFNAYLNDKMAFTNTGVDSLPYDIVIKVRHKLSNDPDGLVQFEKAKNLKSLGAARAVLKKAKKILDIKSAAYTTYQDCEQLLKEGNIENFKLEFGNLFVPKFKRLGEELITDQSSEEKEVVNNPEIQKEWALLDLALECTRNAEEEAPASYAALKDRYAVV